MKRTSTWIATLAISVIVATAAVAQGPGGGGGGGRRFGGQGGPGGRFGMGGGIGMLSIAEVQKELKMTPEQIEKAKTKQDEIRTANREAMEKAGGFQAFQSMSQEERQQMMEKMRATEQKAVGEILDATQQKRYHQLELQQMGARAFSRKDVIEALKITSEQQEKISSVQQERMQQMRESMQGVDFQNMTSDERQQFQAKMMAFQKETNEKTLAVLTAEQQAQWKEMLGAPFTFPARGMGRPPRA